MLYGRGRRLARACAGARHRGIVQIFVAVRSSGRDAPVARTRL